MFGGKHIFEVASRIYAPKGVLDGCEGVAEEGTDSSIGYIRSIAGICKNRIDSSHYGTIACGYKSIDSRRLGDHFVGNR